MIPLTIGGYQNPAPPKKQATPTTDPPVPPMVPNSAKDKPTPTTDPTDYLGFFNTTITQNVGENGSVAIAQRSSELYLGKWCCAFLTTASMEV